MSGSETNPVVEREGELVREVIRSNILLLGREGGPETVASRAQLQARVDHTCILTYRRNLVLRTSRAWATTSGKIQI
jgi:hypothetical protein